MEDSRLKSFFARMKGSFSRKVFKSEKFMILSVCTVLLLSITFGIYASQSIALTVDLDGEVQEVVTSADNVQELLAELDVPYQSRDYLSHRLNMKLMPSMKITWEKAFQVVLNTRGEEEEVWTTAETVEEFLDDQRLSLEEGDVVTPGLQSELMPDSNVEVAHYETEIVEKEYQVNFKTVHKEDPTILKGENRVVAAGVKGKGIYQYEVTYKNGKEIHREMIDQEQIQEKQDRVIAVGIKEPEPQPEQNSKSRVQIASAESQSTSSASSGMSSKSDSQPSKSESRSSSSGGENVIQVLSTAYTANCAGCSGVTATGINLKANPNKKVIAVDPRVIPLGSRVEVEGYGTAIAGDTGGSIQGKRIDVHVPTEDAARAWGKRTVTIRILD